MREILLCLAVCALAFVPSASADSTCYTQKHDMTIDPATGQICYKAEEDSCTNPTPSHCYYPWQ